MFTLQTAFIKHIKDGIATHYNYLDSLYVRPYAGELTKEKITQLSQQLPAVMVMPQPSMPLGQTPNLNMDTIIITKSDSFDKQTNANNNMQLSEALYNYLLENPLFNSAAGNSYRIEFENLEIKLVAIDAKFCIVILDVNFTEQ